MGPGKGPGTPIFGSKLNLQELDRRFSSLSPFTRCPSRRLLFFSAESFGVSQIGSGVVGVLGIPLGLSLGFQVKKQPPQKGLTKRQLVLSRDALTGVKPGTAPSFGKSFDNAASICVGEDS